MHRYACWDAGSRPGLTFQSHQHYLERFLSFLFRVKLLCLSFPVHSNQISTGFPISSLLVFFFLFVIDICIYTYIYKLNVWCVYLWLYTCMCNFTCIPLVRPTRKNLSVTPQVCYRGHSRKRHELAGPQRLDLIAAVVACVRPAQGPADHPSGMYREWGSGG